MKKLALLLGSLLVVGTTVAAKEAVVAPVEVSKEVVVVAEPVAEVIIVEEEPTLKLSGLGYRFVSENRSGKSNGNLGANHFRLVPKFSYGKNWEASIDARRYFTSNTKDSYGPDKLFNKTKTRTLVNVTRNNIFEDYSLGFTYDASNTLDEYDLTFGFAPTNWFDGYVVYGYGSNSASGASDYNYVEVLPKLSYNGWAVGYYFEGTYNIENDGQDEYQQVRFYTPKWNITDKFAMAAEWRLSVDSDFKGTAGERVFSESHSITDPGSKNKAFARAYYQATPTFQVWGEFAYEFGKFEDGENSSRRSNRRDITIGANHKF